MGYIHSSAKHRRSGSTMQQMPARGSHKRALAAREVLPGYPWSGCFNSRQQVDAYLSGNEIACLLCGKPYKMLAPHTKRIHHVSIADYKKRFGIPQNRGINGEENSRLHSEHSKANGLGERARARLEEWRHKPQKRPATPHAPYVKFEMVARLAKAPQDYRIIHNDFTWHIEKCATEFAYGNVPPPPGVASWSTFKKRRNKNSELQAAFKAARSHRMSQRGAINGKRLLHPASAGSHL